MERPEMSHQRSQRNRLLTMIETEALLFDCGYKYPHTPSVQLVFAFLNSPPALILCL